VSKLFPSLAVKVWAVLSSFVTLTRASPPTVSVEGWNAKLSILTALGEVALAEDADDEVPFGVGAFAVPDPPQPTSSAAAMPATAIELMTRCGCIRRPYERRRASQHDATMP
jgi:hypothetical protein